MVPPLAPSIPGHLNKHSPPTKITFNICMSAHQECLQPLPEVFSFYTNAKGELERDVTVPLPEGGSIILLSVPYALDSLGAIHDSTITRKSMKKFNYHPCVVRTALQAPQWLKLDVFICRSFSAVPVTCLMEFVENISADEKKFYIPVVPSLSTNPTPPCPPDFGQPLQLMAGFRFLKPMWVMAVSAEMKLSAGGKVSCSLLHLPSGSFSSLTNLCRSTSHFPHLPALIPRSWRDSANIH